MNIIIKPLSTDLLNDFLFFFDNIVFTENPDWSKCYCYSFHFTGADEEWTKKNNRSAVIKLIGEGKMTGYLAFSNDRPIAWCNVNDRANYGSLSRVYDIEESANEKVFKCMNPVCSFVCKRNLFFPVS